MVELPPHPATDARIAFESTAQEGKRTQNPFFLPFLIPRFQFIARLQGWQVKRDLGGPVTFP
jgi:hypothetical protein